MSRSTSKANDFEAVARLRTAPKPQGLPPGTKANTPIPSKGDGAIVTRQQTTQDCLSSLLSQHPRAIIQIVANPTWLPEQLDAVEGPILEVLYAAMADSNADGSKGAAETPSYLGLNTPLFIAFHERTISDVMLAQEEIQELGLKNTVGGYLPVQSLAGHVMAFAGVTGPGEGERMFNEHVRSIVSLYKPDRWVTWCHVDESKPSDAGPSIVPLLEFPLHLFVDTYEGVARRKEFRTWQRRLTEDINKHTEANA
ncbi:MAG TPA: hypothetical protein VM889_12560 [Candidatus Thermoplasmatota archaeon]|nr:hypothetical protein [Candidatus Thermoplasmatota archaeon]